MYWVISLDKYVNVLDIVKTNMCVGCGTCAGICPKRNIKMMPSYNQGHYLPVMKDSCHNCSICLDVCPAFERILDYSSLKAGLSDEKKLIIGEYLDCYRGYAKLESVRAGASSGGLIPAILALLLQKQVINGALVVRMKKDNPLEAEPFIARTMEEIMEATGSKYCPVATNVMLYYIIEHPGKYAIVGLPCQIQAIRQAQRRLDVIKSRVVLTLGLFCNHTPSFNATEYLLRQMRVNPSDLVELKYRVGWANCASASIINGEIRKIKNYWYLGFGSLFCPTSCSLCKEHTSETADISFGDAWLPEIDRSSLGESIAVVRTDVGRSILSSVTDADAINLKPVSADKVIESQKKSLIEKKIWVNGRICLASRLGIIKLQNRSNTRVGLKQIVKASLFFGKQELGKKKILWITVNLFYLTASNIYKYLKNRRGWISSFGKIKKNDSLFMKKD